MSPSSGPSRWPHGGAGRRLAQAGEIAERTHPTMNFLRGCGHESPPVAFSSASNHWKAWTMTHKLKPEDIERLRTMLKPRCERHDFKTTMDRGANLASDARPPSDPR